MTLADIRRQFEELDASGDGVITKEDIEMQEKRRRQQELGSAVTPILTPIQQGGSSPTPNVQDSSPATTNAQRLML